MFLGFGYVALCSYLVWLFSSSGIQPEITPMGTVRPATRSSGLSLREDLNISSAKSAVLFSGKWKKILDGVSITRNTFWCASFFDFEIPIWFYNVSNLLHPSPTKIMKSETICIIVVVVFFVTLVYLATKASKEDLCQTCLLKWKKQPLQVIANENQDASTQQAICPCCKSKYKRHLLWHGDKTITYTEWVYDDSSYITSYGCSPGRKSKRMKRSWPPQRLGWGFFCFLFRSVL